jgi:hypothetical protein
MQGPRTSSKLRQILAVGRLRRLLTANRAVNNQSDGILFDRSLLDYDGAADSYRCPAGSHAHDQDDGILFDCSLFDYDGAADSYRWPVGRTFVRKQILRRDNCVLRAFLHD